MPDGFSLDEALKPAPDQSAGFSLEDAIAANPTYERNKAWTKKGAKDFRTQLSPAEEEQFQSWTKANKVPNDDGPQSDYDMRGFWKALQANDPKATSAVDPNDKRLHYPDYWKTPYHETFSNESQWADPDKAPKWNDKDQLVGADGKVLFDDRAKNKPADDLPWDVPMSGAQMRAARADQEKADASLQALRATAPAEPGLKHLFWSLFGGPAELAARGGQQMLGERPPPTPVEALQEASLGAVPFRAGLPADAAAAAAKARVEPPPPAAPGAGPTIDELGIKPSFTDGAPFSLEEASRPYQPSTEKAPSSLDEAGITPKAPEPATETETVAQPQADGTVKQVEVKTGEPPPPPEPPKPATPVEDASPIGPGFRALFPDLSDEQFEALFQQAAEQVTGGIPISPAATRSWLNRLFPVMQRLAATEAAAQQKTEPKEPELTPESLAQARDKFAQATPPEPQKAAPAQEQPQQEPVAEPAKPEPVQGHGGPWTPVLKDDGTPAKNHLGDVIYENPNGVRAIMEGGVPWTERVRRTDQGMVPASPESRKPHHMVEGEQAKPAEEPRNEAQPEPEKPAEPKKEEPAKAEEPAAKPKPIQMAAKPADPKPDAPIIPPGDEYYPPVRSGEIVRSKSGREMAQAPKFTVDTNRAANIARGKMNQWLVDETKAEAEATGDTYMQQQFRGLDGKNVSPSDRDMMIDYLWDNETGPLPEHRGEAKPKPAAPKPEQPKPVAEAPKPKPEAKPEPKPRAAAAPAAPVPEPRPTGGRKAGSSAIPSVRDTEPPAPKEEPKASEPTEAEAQLEAWKKKPKHSMAKTQAEFEAAYNEQQRNEPPLSSKPEYINGLADELDALPDTVLGKKRLMTELRKGPGQFDREVIREELDRLVEGDHITETPFVRAFLLGEDGGYSPLEMRNAWANYRSYVYPQEYIDKVAADPRDLKDEITNIKRQLSVPRGERDPMGDGPPLSAVERMAYEDNLAALEQRQAANDQKPKPEEPPKSADDALSEADAAYKAHYPLFEQATQDFRKGTINKDQYLAVRAEHERLKAAWGDAALRVRREFDDKEAAEADIPLLKAFQEGRSPVPEPGEAYKGMAPPDAGNIRGQDSKGNTWVGTGRAIVREDADKGFPGMAKRGEARKRKDHRLIGLNPNAFDKLTNGDASDQPIAWKRIVKGPTEGKDYVIGTTPQGHYIILEKPYFDLISRAAGPDGTLSTAEPSKKEIAGKDTILNPIFARRPDGTVVGVGMPIRWLKRSARIMATGDDGEAKPLIPATPPPPAIQPADTPAATGKPDLKSGEKKPTVPPQEAPDAGNGRPSGNGGLGKPGGGAIRPPGSGSGVGGGSGGRPKLAPSPADDVAPAGGLGDTGKDGVRPEPEAPGGDEPLPESGDAPDGRPGAGGEGLDAPGAGGKTGPELDLSKPKEPKVPTPRGREVEIPDETRPNFFISDPERMVGGGDKARFNRNRRAIEAFQSITEEGRDPTEEELETMAGFTGWGSFGQDLFQGTFERQPSRPGWDTEAQWLRNHLGKAAWDAAHNSISNAHYTDPPTVEAMWNMARQMGFKGGRVLEPSMGIGNFFGLMPRDLMEQSTLTGIELDPTTGGMAKMLYPQAGVFIKGYQESKTPDNFYDLVIGNWPFDATPPADRRYNRLKPTLHDYFYLKALDQTRPGGLVIGITSAGTMDKMDRAARMEMAKKGELVAAFRLPTGAFEKYAGTKVVTDIVILRKRSQPLVDPSNEPWVNTKEMDTPAGEPIRVNQYFHDHPENVLGTFDYGHGTTTFRPGMLVHRPPNMMERLQALPETLPTDAYQPIVRGDEPRFITSNTADRLNSVIIGNDGNLYQVAGERMLRLDDVFKGMTAGTKKIQQERADQVRALINMRKTYGALIDAERDGNPDMEDLRKDLRDQYEAYNKPVKGLMIDTPGMKVLDRVRDPNWAMLAALQRPDGSPALILTSAIVRPRRQIGNPSVADAYVMARNESVNIDMDRIGELSGRSAEEAAKSLMDAGAVYRTPGGGYEASDAYLSGNVRLKLREAQDAVERGEPMEASVEALTKVIPKNTPYYQIEAKFGAPWVSPDDYRNFIGELLDLPEDQREGIDVSFQGGRWQVALGSPLLNTIEATQTHGHPRYRFDRLLTAAMGNTSPRIMDPRDRDGGPYYNARASEEVATRIQEVREKFQDWIWKDAERTVRLEAAFNEAVNAVAKPHFDGSFMDMSGMALLRGDDPFNMRRHQANGIWRGISQRRGAFFHEVGTGKTYTIGGIAIEGRRYGRWNKPLLVAHNANSKAVARDIQAMYPGAKVLSIDSDNLTPKTLKQSMYSIRNEDWDLVVVQHSHLNRFALKKETLMGLAREQITAIEDEMFAAADESGDNLDKVNLEDEKDIEKKIRGVTAKQLAKQRLKILNKIEEQGQRASREDAIPFEDLGIDCILVDEAHEFKKPPIATRMKLKGLNTEASAMSIGLDFLTKYIKNNNNGNNVFLFTGTPVTNSLNEIFNMSKYFMDDVMKRDGFGDWDTWFNTFADALNDVELVATGDYESIRRLSSFNNVDELVLVMSQFTDVVQASDMPEFVDRPTPSGKTLSSPDLTPEERDFLENGRTENPIGRPYKRIINDVGEILPEQAVIQEELRQVIRDFKAAEPRFRKENRHIPVVVETQMSNASLDPRMHDPTLKENPNNKINRVAKNVLEIYQTPKAAQMIFVDSGYNPGKLNPNFNMVGDLIDKLVKGGIPRNEIAVVAGRVKPEKKAQIAADMNSGKIRIAIGQSDTLGVGVNAQENLRAMHHMDAPWMPGELEQRDGRGHRAGNAWNTVLEYRYITEGIDGKRWQVLTIKDRFIKQFIGAFNDESGKRLGSIEGDAADISEKEDIVGTLSAAAGDPRLMLREKLKSDVNRLQRREQQHTYGVADAQRRARQIEEDITPVRRRAALKARLVNLWVKAQERMEAAAEEAGSKNRWYDAVIDGVPMKTSADIQDAMDKRVAQLAQAEGKVKIGTINGFGIEADWPKGWTEPSFYLTDDMGQEIPATGMSGAVTVQRILGRIQALKKDAEGAPRQIETMQADVEKLKKAAELPFTQGEALLKKRQQLAKIEDDLAENPVPPPAWLRHGAAIDTPIWVDGQERIVRGHRMSDDYYIVTDEGDVPYMRATDQNGFNLFTMKPPPARSVRDVPEWAPPEIAKSGIEGAEVIWHAGDLVLVHGRRDGETTFFGFKKGLPEDRQAHDIWAPRGAFEVKDIDRMRKEAQAHRDREENKKRLEETQEPEQTDLRE